MSVLCKKTFDLVPGREPVPSEAPIEFHEEGGDFETDLVAFKPLTDIILVGKVHVPRGRSARFLDAEVRIGNRTRVVRVFGPRTAEIGKSSILGRQTVRFTDPTPFESAPLDVGHAYGGVDAHSHPDPVVCRHNPHGTGFALKAGDLPREIPLPLLENPLRLLEPESFLAGERPDWNKVPRPAYFGFCPANSWPRSEMAGMAPEHAVDLEVQRRKAVQSMSQVGAGPGTIPPAAPPILNPEFHQRAAPGLRFSYLSGREAMVLKHFHPDHPQWTFELPGEKPTAWIGTGKETSTMDMVLQTVEIRPDEGRMALVWRGSVFYGGAAALSEFEALEFGIQGD